MSNPRIGFVIMQIGNEDLDNLYNNVFCEALDKAGLDPKRIDKDNSGKLLKTEIIEYIEAADIIIADLTNERPNCYLEVGYAMGLDKFKNMIFTVREDHHHASPNYNQNGPKVHFDLSGYEILFWDSNKLETFKESLYDKIMRRLLIIDERKEMVIREIWDKDWVNERRQHGLQEVESINSSTSMEILISPLYPKIVINQKILLEIANDSQIETFGWPIGIVYANNHEYKPKPKNDGIISELKFTSDSHMGKSYDMSYFKKNGQIYIFKDLYEERYYPGKINYIVRIKRITEIFLYTSRFFTKCNLPANEKIQIKINYNGLLNKILTSGNNGFGVRGNYTSNENEVETEITTSISEIETRLPELVEQMVEPLLTIFDYFHINKDSIKEIVNKFVSDTVNASR